MRLTTVASVMEQIKINSVFDEISCYEVYSIDSTILTPLHTLTIPMIHSISTTSNEMQQQTCKKHLPKQRDLPEQKQLLHASIDRYFLIIRTIRSRDPIYTLHINNNQRNAISNSYGPPPSSSISLP